MIFSKQSCFCQICGVEMFISLAGPGYKRVCSKACVNELDWRKTLSIMGKEYYPDPGKAK